MMTMLAQKKTTRSKMYMAANLLNDPLENALKVVAVQPNKTPELIMIMKPIAGMKKRKVTKPTKTPTSAIKFVERFNFIRSTILSEPSE